MGKTASITYLTLDLTKINLRMTALKVTTLGTFGPNHPMHQSCTAHRNPAFLTRPGKPLSRLSSTPTKAAAAWLRPQALQP